MKNKTNGKPADMPPPILYRVDLLRLAKRNSILGFRDIAGYTRLAVMTVTQAFEGNATKIATIYKLADFFGIPWVAMFDTQRKLRVIPSPDKTGFVIADGTLIGSQGVKRI